MVNTDKYKNFKSADEEKQRHEDLRKAVAEQLDDVQKELGEVRRTKDELQGEVDRLSSANHQLQESEANQSRLL